MCVRAWCGIRRERDGSLFRVVLSNAMLIFYVWACVSERFGFKDFFVGLHAREREGAR